MDEPFRVFNLKSLGKIGFLSHGLVRGHNRLLSGSGGLFHGNLHRGGLFLSGFERTGSSQWCSRFSYGITSIM